MPRPTNEEKGAALASYRLVIYLYPEEVERFESFHERLKIDRGPGVSQSQAGREPFLRGLSELEMEEEA